MTWATFLLGLAGPLVTRALTYLGFGLVSFLAVKTAFALLITAIQARWMGLPAAVLQLASLAHAQEALGLVLGAQVARVALWVKVKGASWIAGARS